MLRTKQFWKRTSPWNIKLGHRSMRRKGAHTEGPWSDANLSREVCVGGCQKQRQEREKHTQTETRWDRRHGRAWGKRVEKKETEREAGERHTERQRGRKGKRQKKKKEREAEGMKEETRDGDNWENERQRVKQRVRGKQVRLPSPFCSSPTLTLPASPFRHPDWFLLGQQG